MDSSPTAAARRAAAIARHLAGLPFGAAAAVAGLQFSPCLSYAPPESSGAPPAFAPMELRALLDGHHLRERDWAYGAMEESPLFCPRRAGGKVFVSPDYNEGKEGQREATMRRIGYLTRRGVFRGWLTEPGPDAELHKLALLECLGVYDHSLAIKIEIVSLQGDQPEQSTDAQHTKSRNYPKRRHGRSGDAVDLTELSHRHLQAFSVLTPPQRSPLLQKQDAFKDAVSWVRRKAPLDRYLVTDMPK
ncbi:hypothetical protein TRIUR3_06747 [Triticum urartu]|uniref:Uncharacterized protein n=1 Tax=Triticum urartu TaxID=4572 RepID=M7ZRE1_TRIUA|nr:hypothetical protein TRIUR3_06747 [Triticum urartu]